MSKKAYDTDSIMNILHERVSTPRLLDPAPQGQVLQNILSSALRAPDHKVLRPARYLIIEGEARHKLGEIFVRATENKLGELSNAKIQKCRNMPLRAPMVLVAISKNITHPKVPFFEQEQTVAVGLGYILLALQAQGFGGIWRTGDMAVDELVRQELGLERHESLVGFLYIGTPEGEPKRIASAKFDDHFAHWTGV